MESEELRQRSRQLAEQQAGVLGGERAGGYLQAGEDVESPYLEDAEHWISVYRELVGFKRDLLRDIDQHVVDADHPQSEQEMARDRSAAELELERIQLHLEYWIQRREELRALEG
ncbi:MAG: hypothetical protein J2P38_00205 [Candidatus Dormibacteraeota bacterium]|nr:hypothetical protein [Candidatus Dormibacteraeota bacterium]